MVGENLYAQAAALLPLTCNRRMNCGKRWMGLTIRPYRVILSVLDACFLWGHKKNRAWGGLGAVAMMTNV